MNIDLEQYTGRCACGGEHRLLTREVLIQSGAIRELPGVIGRAGLGGTGCIICDSNTAPHARLAAEQMGDRLDRTIELPAENLHADEHAVEQVQNRLPETGWLAAVGSGTVHDATRYVANERGIPFLSIPTAASVDGFLSSNCAMTWHGFKKTTPGVAPIAMVADTDIFRKAPYRLTAAGVGDVLGKYISLADWEISHVVTGDPICPRIHGITREAVDNVLESLPGLRGGDPAAYEQLMFAQVLSGIGMQLWGNSRPASGAEHHLSHLWEMEVICGHLDALHGEKVGVGLLLALDAYAPYALREGLQGHLTKQYEGMLENRLREVFGSLCDSVLEENHPDPLLEVDPKEFARQFPKVREILQSLPDREKVRQAMVEAGCLTTLEELGLSRDILEQSLELAPFVRRRITMLRLRHLLDESRPERPY